MRHRYKQHSRIKAVNRVLRWIKKHGIKETRFDELLKLYPLLQATSVENDLAKADKEIHNVRGEKG